MFKRRHLYVLVFALPALLLSLIAAAVMLAASAGALWLFVFGDAPWPETANVLLGSVFILSGAGLWLALVSIAWAVGKRQENRPTLNRAHVAFAIGATAVLAAAIVGRLTGAQLGTRSVSLVCADACREKGFAGSGTPPSSSNDSTCSCYDAQGREAERIDLSAPATRSRPGP